MGARSVASASRPRTTVAAQAVVKVRRVIGSDIAMTPLGAEVPQSSFLGDSSQHVAQHLSGGDERDRTVGAIGESGFEIVSEEMIGRREQVLGGNGAIDDRAADGIGLADDPATRDAAAGQ